VLRSFRAFFTYALLTVALTWPLAANLTIMDAGDSAFFAWETAWELHALTTDPARLPHANIFHPLRFTLGMDEPVLGTTILALPLWPFTTDAVWLYNVLRLLTFALSGLTAYWLARELGCDEAPALFAGAAFAFSPIRTDQIAHLSTLGTQWLPALLLFMHRFARTGRVQDALLASLFFVLEFLACGYHGVIGLAILPLGALVLLSGRFRERLPMAILATALAGLALLPLYLLHHEALAPERYSRSNAETVFYSATLESFLATSSWNRVWGEATAPFRTLGPNNLFPGLTVLLLPVAGAIVLWKRRARPSRDVLALLVIGMAAVIVACGPEVRAFGHALFPSPFGLLRQVLPIFQMIRVTSRAGVYLALPLAVLAAKGLGALRLPALPTALVATLGLAETLIAPIPMPEWTKIIDSRREPPAVYRWLADQPSRPPVVHLPMLDVYGLERRPRYHESIYMVYSTLHWNPLVNGYAGIEPAHYVRMRELARGFPSRELVDALREVGVRYVVLHRGGYGPVQWPRIEGRLPDFKEELVPAASFGEDTVFELRARPAAAGAAQN
jgi:succinate dehydrogenase/fumarate reductase cytochrome b subunit